MTELGELEKRGYEMVLVSIKELNDCNEHIQDLKNMIDNYKDELDKLKKKYKLMMNKLYGRCLSIHQMLRTQSN